MKNFVAHFLSIILIPLLAPAYLYAIILFYYPTLTDIAETGDKLLAILYIFAATSLLPFVLVFILYKKKVISTLTLDNVKDRFIPQVFSCFSYVAISGALALMFGYNNALTLSMVAVTVSVIGLTIITPYWKISTHACGAWGMFAILYVLNQRFHVQSFMPVYYTILVCVIGVCFARLYLKVHTPMQVLMGSIMGTVIGFSVFNFLL